jgi:hypothetical protein
MDETEIKQPALCWLMGPAHKHNKLCNNSLMKCKEKVILFLY